MNYLSLFSGAGGGDLACQHLLGWICKGYVEYEPYCQEVIKARIKDGFLDAGPGFGDIRRFIEEGYAEAYQGMVDCIFGGDPCQDNSIASWAGSPTRSMGEEYLRCVEIIKPRFVIRENPTPSRKAAPWKAKRFMERLSGLGYVAVPTLGRSCCFGRDHRRSRLFVQACTAHFDRKPNTQAAAPQDAVRGIPGARVELAGKPGGVESRVSWMLSESDILRKNDGVARGVERYRAIGNGIDPTVAAAAWRILTGAE